MDPEEALKGPRHITGSPEIGPAKCCTPGDRARQPCGGWSQTGQGVQCLGWWGQVAEEVGGWGHEGRWEKKQSQDCSSVLKAAHPGMKPQLGQGGPPSSVFT